jgi:hypothetical protein
MVRVNWPLGEVRDCPEERVALEARVTAEVE